MPEEELAKASAATTLRLPPTFVADHCVRTLAAQGAMTLGELTRHWRVSGDVATGILDAVRNAGLIESENVRTNIETGQRWRLSAAGHARVETARARTWYAGPLPVSAQEYASSFAEGNRVALNPDLLRAALAPFDLEDETIADIGQAIASGASLLLGGCADDEQPAIANALASAFAGAIKLPHAIFAAGAVIRMADPRIHRAVESAQSSGEGALRSRESFAPWMQIQPPAVTLTGGLIPADVVPPFDADARFYIAPAPMTASGGILTICNGANSDPQALEHLSRYWLVPSAGGVGMLLLRTGERVEVPWGAAVVIFASPEELPISFAAAVAYHVDAAPLEAAALRRFLAGRLPANAAFTSAAVDGIARLLERVDLARRQPAAAVARYLRDRSVYEDVAFTLSDDALNGALRFAAVRLAPAPAERAA